jgi:cell division protein ZipA
MNIFHSMHNGSTVFSIAKMVEPGFFDINNPESFQTPGVTLILQLPGPVPADVAFEVLVSEAFEIANELGATVLDERRSTLTKQTVQHMREGIYEYMHREKYFGNVPS